MSSNKWLASYLEDNQDKILKIWEERVRECIPAAQNLDSLALVNSLPRFLEELTESLASPKNRRDPLHEEQSLAKEHGEERSVSPGYDLTQVIKEYQVLRQILFEVLEEKQPTTSEQRDIILDAFSIGIRKAAAEFVRLRTWQSKQANQRLRESEERYRVAIEGVQDHAIIRSDLNGIIVDWNRGAEKIFGYSKSEVTGKSASIIFTPEDLAEDVDEQEMKDARERNCAEDKRWHVRKDGSRFFATGIMNPLRTNEGELFGYIKVLRDNTEAKKNESDLAFERHKLETIFKDSPAAMALWKGSDLIFEKVNPQYQAFFGDRKLVGKALLEALPELEGQEFPDLLKKVYETGEPVIGHEMLAQVVRSKGGPLEDRYYDFTYLQIRDSDGRPYGVYDHAIDVTEKVLARKKLEESERQIRTYAEAMPQMAFVADENGEIKYFNQRFYEYIGLSSKEALGSQWKEIRIHHPEDLQRTIETWQHSIETGEPYQIEYRLKRYDGEYRWHLGRAVPARDQEGHIIRWYGTNTDIHDQKKVQEQMAEATHLAEIAHEELHSLFMQAPVALVRLTGPEHRFTLANPLYERMVGREVAGKTLLEAFTAKEAEYYLPILDEVYQTGKPYVGTELPLNIPDESGNIKKHYINLIYHPFRDRNDNITGIFAVVHDVTEQVEAARERQMHIEDLKTERELRERFTNTLTHDMRTPLGTAKMSAQLVLKYRDNEKKRDWLLHKIVESLERTDKMIEDLLDANRIKAGEKLPLNIAECNLKPIVEQSLDELAIAYGNRFRFNYENDCTGYWSCEGLRRVIDNLVGNAVKYGSQDALITICIECDKELVHLSVHNFGNPIPLREAKSLFEPFHRAKIAEKSNQRGWGIGLTLVKGIVEAHGGRVWLESESEKGTTFTVELPMDCRDTEKSGNLS